MPDTFDVAQQTLPGGNVNEPASGAYGAQVDLERLKQALQGPGAVKPTPGPGPMGTQPEGKSIPPPGGPQPLPQVLMAPTNQPNTPAFTPLQAPPQNPVMTAQTSRQRNLAILDHLANDPTASSTTREWAAALVRRLAAG